MSNLGTLDGKVHTGTWTNWSHGKVVGSTLTLTQTNGSFLVAFLALFVSFAGTSFFRITCFIIHHNLSNKKAQDAIYHQRQAILRNSASGTQAFLSLSSMIWSYLAQRPRKQRIFRRLAPLLAHTSIVIAVFAVAGIFSSRITGLTGDEVLLRSTSLDPGPANYTKSDLRLFLMPYLSNGWRERARYAEECYSSSSAQDSAICQKFVKKQLSREIDRNAPCPFSNGLCKSEFGNIRIDTGFLDSNNDLGFNTPSADRIRLRQVLHCAPLATEGFAEKRNISVGNFSLPYSLYHYGPVLPPSGYDDLPVNHTHIEPIETRNLLDPLMPLGPMPGQYNLKVVGAPSLRATVQNSIAWAPNEGLLRNDSDVVLLFLTSKSLFYRAEVDDPWFSAHERYVEVVANGRNDSYFLAKADEAASPLACATSVQICHQPFSDTSKCSLPQGVVDITGDEAYMDYPSNLTSAQRNMSAIFASSMLLDTSIYLPVSMMGGYILQAKNSLQHGQQTRLPDNQWQLEVEHMSAVVLSGLQSAIVEYATGPSDPRLIPYYASPEAPNEQQKLVARNIKVRSTTHANFSVLGLAIILTVGTLILLTEAILECVYVRVLWRGRDWHQYKRIEWSVNGTLQLQRLAHEQLGYGPWKGCDEEIPLLAGDGQLATLDLRNPKHPRLRARAAEARELSRPDTGGETLWERDGSVKAEREKHGQSQHEIEVEDGSQSSRV